MHNKPEKFKYKIKVSLLNSPEYESNFVIGKDYPGPPTKICILHKN